MKGDKASDDSKSNIKKLCNNIMVSINALKTKLQRYQLLTGWWLDSEMGKFCPILVLCGITSESVGFYSNF